jgi:hypothetical protein
MGYWLEEHLETGESTRLGDPFFDLRVAKVIASQRALRIGRVIVVVDERTTDEVARYEPSGAPNPRSVTRMRADAVQLLEPPENARKTSA